MVRTIEYNRSEILASSKDLSELFNTAVAFARLGKKRTEEGGSSVWINSDYDPKNNRTYLVQVNQNGNLITALQIGELLTNLYSGKHVMQIGFSPLSQINFSRDTIIREKWQVGVFDQVQVQPRADNISMLVASKVTSSLKAFLPKGTSLPIFKIEAVDLTDLHFDLNTYTSG